MCNKCEGLSPIISQLTVGQTFVSDYAKAGPDVEQKKLSFLVNQHGNCCNIGQLDKCTAQVSLIPIQLIK